MVDHTTLGTAGRIRYLLGEAASRLELAIAAPYQDNEMWRKQVDASLEELRFSLMEHIELTEADNGLLDQVIEDAPRLVPAVEVIMSDHAELCEAIDLAKDIVDHARIEDTHEIRSAVVDLLARLFAHRQRGADLVFDAYNVDIGGLSGE
jgi:hypothetical protein